MGRAPCCDKANVKKGPWSPEEDAKLKEFIEKHGTGGNWIVLPKKAGLKRCGKSCRLRWLNYLRPNIKHGEFSEAEDKIICSLYASIGSRWSVIASQLQGRTDNDIKNYWNTKLKKKLMAMNHSMEKKPQQVTLLSIFQNSTSPSSLSFTDTSNNNNNNNNSYYHSNGTFTGSVSSSLLSGNSSTSVSNSSIFQAQESFIGSTQKCQFKDRNKTFVFGGEATSCSSSNGSCSNQVSHVKEQELVYGDYLCSGVEDTQKLMFSSAGGVNGLWVENENPMDYGGLEEIKELISTSSCNNFLFDDDDDKKTEEKVMYY